MAFVGFLGENPVTSALQMPVADRRMFSNLEPELLRGSLARHWTLTYELMTGTACVIVATMKGKPLGSFDSRREGGFPRERERDPRWKDGRKEEKASEITLPK